jgi:hypothetical protein
MTARKNQAQAVIFKASSRLSFIGPFRRTQLRFEMSLRARLGRIKSSRVDAEYQWL